MTTEQSPAQIEHAIEIDASPARVWEIVGEVRNSPQWSTQAVKVVAFGGRTTKGTIAINVNKQAGKFWLTSSKVVDFEPGRRIANRVYENFTVWAFELEPTPTGGTRLTERRETPQGVSAFSKKLTDMFFGGQEKFLPILNKGVSRSLERIKTLAESRA